MARARSHDSNTSAGGVRDSFRLPVRALCRDLGARVYVSLRGADGPWLSAAGDLACAVAMVAKIESIAKILGPELNEKWEMLADDCIYGLNGQPLLWESHPDRIFSLLSARIRLGK